MIRVFLPVLAALLPAIALADTVIARHTIRSQTILSAQDIALTEGDTPDGLTALEDAVGMETRVVLYAGRPIRPGDIGPPALIERNQIVSLTYAAGSLVIATEARALGRAGVGDVIRVMNLTSRSTVSGIVRPNGSVSAGALTPPSS